MDIRPGYRKTRNTISTVGIGVAGFSSVVGFGIFRFAGHRLDIAPGTTVCGITLFLLFFGQFLKGDHFSHSGFSFRIYGDHLCLVADVSRKVWNCQEIF